MNQTKCKFGDEYYELQFSRERGVKGTMYQGVIFLDSPMEFKYSVDEGEIATFKPEGTNEDLINNIKDAIDDCESNPTSGIVD